MPFLPLKFWFHDVSIAAYLINKLPSPTTNNVSPFEIRFKSPLDICHLKVFGCACYPLLKPYNKHKAST